MYCWVLEHWPSLFDFVDVTGEIDNVNNVMKSTVDDFEVKLHDVSNLNSVASAKYLNIKFILRLSWKCLLIYLSFIGLFTRMKDWYVTK